MFNSRQFQTIELLKNKNVSLDKLSKVVGKSSRTIMRDINRINDYLEDEEIGKITFIKEDDGYKLNIFDEDRLDELLKDWINDEDNILFLLLTNEFLTIEDISEKLYISIPVVSGKLANLKEIYRETLKISCSKKGHYIEEQDDKKVNLLSNLIYNKDRYFLKLIDLDYKIYKNIIEYFNSNKEEILEEYPNINGRQFASVLIAVYILHKDGEKTNEEGLIFDVYLKNGLAVTEEMVEELDSFILGIRKKLRRLTRGRILDILLEIEEKQGIKIYDMDLVRELVLHINRSISYPFILKGHEIYNLHDIKIHNPFAFDISQFFARKLEEEIDIKIYDVDLLGLYFICSLGRVKKQRQNVVIIGRQISLANINRSIIEDNINDVDVKIVSSIEELEDLLVKGTVSLLINNSSNIDVKAFNIKTLRISQIISSKEINEIRRVIDNITLKESIDDIFKREYYFNYEVKNETWVEVIEVIGNLLKEKGIINEEEKGLIVEREKQDNLLIINKISIPHCMTKRTGVCVGAYISLSKELIAEGQAVNNIAVVVINPEDSKTSKIFSYMYKAINKEKKTEDIKTYEDFINMMKEGE